MLKKITSISLFTIAFLAMTFTALAVLIGDANNDGKVNDDDFSVWKNSYLNKIAGGTPAKGDFNSDGKVDGVDYALWFGSYGTSPGSTATPKPSGNKPSASPVTQPSPVAQPSSVVISSPTSSSAYRAFKADSYWNVPMPANAPIDPNNAKYIADAKNTSVSIPFFHLAGAPGHAAGDAWAYPVYWAKSSDPVYHITPRIGGPAVDARIPVGATPQSGSDGGIIVYDLASDQVVEMWQASFNSSSNTWSCSSTKRYVLSSNGLTKSVKYSDSQLNDGHRGVATPTRAVRRDEVASGKIAHRLECFWHATAEQHYWPMNAHESGKGGVTPEGIVIRLKPSVSLENRGLSSGEKVIARALQEYGCIVGDNEGGNGNTIKLERGKDQWAALDPGLDYNGLSTFTWDDYEFIQGGYNPVTGAVVN